MAQCNKSLQCRIKYSHILGKASSLISVNMSNSMINKYLYPHSRIHSTNYEAGRNILKQFCRQCLEVYSFQQTREVLRIRLGEYQRQVNNKIIGKKTNNFALTTKINKNVGLSSKKSPTNQSIAFNTNTWLMSIMLPLTIHNFH